MIVLIHGKIRGIFPFLFCPRFMLITQFLGGARGRVIWHYLPQVRVPRQSWWRAGGQLFPGPQCEFLVPVAPAATSNTAPAPAPLGGG